MIGTYKLEKNEYSLDSIDKQEKRHQWNPWISWVVHIIWITFLITFCKTKEASTYDFSLFSDKVANLQCLFLILPLWTTNMGLKYKLLLYSECPFLFFSFFFCPQNKRSWMGRIFKWHSGSVCDYNINILSKELFKGPKVGTPPFIWLILPNNLSSIWAYLMRFSHWATNPHKPAHHVSISPHWA